MATQEIKDLLLEAGPFARLSASEQRTRLVKIYEPWFTPGWKPDTVNNIRCTQRLITHSKSMAMSVGVVLQAILEEASGRSPHQPLSLVRVACWTWSQMTIPRDPQLETMARSLIRTDSQPEPRSATFPEPDLVPSGAPAPSRSRSRSKRVR